MSAEIEQEQSVKSSRPDDLRILTLVPGVYQYEMRPSSVRSDQASRQAETRSLATQDAQRGLDPNARAE